MPPFLLALLVLSAAAGVAAVTPRVLVTPGAGGNLTIGALLPLANTWAPHQPDVNYWRAAAQLGVEGVNADAALLPNHTLVLEIGDTRGDERESPFAALDLAESGAAALVGPVLGRGTARTAAYASSRGGVNHIDMRSDSSDLEAQGAYAFHHRLQSGNADQARAVLAVARHLGWTRVGVVVDAHRDTNDVYARLRDLAPSHGVEIARTVNVVFGAGADEAGAPLGSTLDFTRRIVEQREVRVWVHLVSRVYSARFRLAVDAAGGGAAGFSWIIPPAGMWDLAESVALQADTELRVFRAGDVILVPLAYAQAEAVVGPWRERLRARAVEGTAVAAADAAVDPYWSRWLHDSVVVAARGLDALVRLVNFCDEAAAPGDHENCTAMAADASQDRTLARLIRTTPVSEGILGFPIAFNPATGTRATSTVAVQAGETEESVTNPAMVTPGGHVVEIGAWLWRGGGDEPPPDRPATERSTHELRETVVIAVETLAAAGLLMCLACAALTVAYRKHPIVRMSSYRINLVSTVGGAALMAVQIPLTRHLTDAACTARLWILPLGFSLLYGPLFAKMLRIWRIFGGTRIHTVRITDRQLGEVIAAVVAVDLALLSAWQATSPPGVRLTPGEPQPTDDALLYRVAVEQVCSGGGGGDALFLTMVAYKAALLAAGSYLAFKTRNVAVKALNDARWVGLSVYTTAVIAALAVPVALLLGTESREATLFLEAGAVLLVVVSTMALVFLPKFIAIWGGNEEAWTRMDHGSADSGSGSGHASCGADHRVVAPKARQGGASPAEGRKSLTLAPLVPPGRRKSSLSVAPAPALVSVPELPPATPRAPPGEAPPAPAHRQPAAAPAAADPPV